MRIAIYSRKSKWTGKGDSIENQLLMCKEYILSNFPDIKEENIFEYEDEGFSGKNTQRPEFQMMMEDMKKKHYDFLVCYKLDRLGRNLADLVNLIEELNRMDTSFISIKEKFDTSTPIGRAMMFFTGVLAQMEREQIAERVKDNMLMLARSGRWLGGTTPLGFHSKKDESLAWNNKVKITYRLEVNEKELDTVRFIYNKFLENQSLSWLNTYFSQNDIKTRNGKEYQITTIRDILTNPVYCTADREAYDFFCELGCQVCIDEDELDGKHGLISYGKTSSAKYKNKQSNPTEWIISLAKHEGIIIGKDWVRVQNLLNMNKKKGENFHKVQNPVALLSGILYCKCGYPMRPKYYPAERIDKKGNRTFAYLCSQKEKSNRKKCNISNVYGNMLDQMICDEVMKYMKPDVTVGKGLAKIKDNLEATQNCNRNELELLNQIVSQKKNQIHQLIVFLSKTDDNEMIVPYIKQQVNQLDQECKEMENRITNHFNNYNENAISKDKKLQVEELFIQLSTFQNAFEAVSVPEKREFLRFVLDQVVWDGENAHIYFYKVNHNHKT